MEKLVYILPILLIAAVVIEVDNRNAIRKEFPEGLKDHHSLFFFLIACFILSAAFAFLSAKTNFEYTALQEKYDSLQEKYEYIYGEYQYLLYDGHIPSKEE